MAKIDGVNITIGASPEVFIKKNGQFIGANFCMPYMSIVKKGRLEAKGYGVKVITDFAPTFKGFDTNLTSVMESLNKFKPASAEVVVESLPKKVMYDGTNSVVQYNAYTGLASNTSVVTGEGGLHIAWRHESLPADDEYALCDPLAPSHLEACCWLAQTLDAYIGMPSLSWDENKERRELNGKAGTFIPKPYGMEYRVLSNAWIKTPQTRMLVFENTLEAIAKLRADPSVRNKKYENKSAQQIVDSSDKDSLIKTYHYSDIKSVKHYREIIEKVV